MGHAVKLSGVAGVLLATTALAFAQADFPTSGKVVDALGAPVAEAFITYQSVDKRLEWTYSRADGTFGTKTSTRAPSMRNTENSLNAAVIGQALYFSADADQRVTVDVFDMSGRMVQRVVDKQFSAGRYTVRPMDALSAKCAQGTYVLHIRSNNAVANVRMLNSARQYEIGSVGTMQSRMNSQSLAKVSKATAVDSLRVGKNDFLPTYVSLETYSADVGQVVIVTRGTEKKVDSLFALFAQADKVGQLAEPVFPGGGDFTTYKIGFIFGGGSDGPGNDISPKSWADFNDNNQSVTSWPQLPLKVPVMIGLDNVHGVGKCRGSTIFPHNIGMGATWDPKIVEKVYRVNAIESIALGVNFVFAPCVAVPRHENWGRVYEGFGEMPDLVRALSRASIKGLQGTDLSNPLAVAACAKHFAGDGGTTGGINIGNTEGNDAALRAMHLVGYEEAVKLKCASIMPSFTRWNGVLMHQNTELMTNWLKTQQGFDGFLNGDWNAHKEGGMNADVCISAGLDVPMLGNGSSSAEITGSINAMMGNAGKAARVSDAVKRVLRVKFRMDLFNRRVIDRRYTDLVGCAEHRAVAREAVRKSLVLLKNTGSVLPLDKNANVTIQGAHGDDIGLQCGGWTVGWQGAAGNVTTGTTIKQGFTEVITALGGTGQVTYQRTGGTASTGVVVVVLGEQPYAETPGDDGDRSLDAGQVALVSAAKAAGKKVVLVVISGRCVNIAPIVANCDAIVAAWLPGTEGAGIAEVLYGKSDFSGKLPHSWPKNATDPCNVGDADYANKALFAYDFGLKLNGTQLTAGLYQ
jgi:beta-glucosidase